MPAARVVELGDSALTLVLGEQVDASTNLQVMAARDALPKFDGITDIVPSYCSLTVHFDPLRLSPEVLHQALLVAAQSPAADVDAGKAWQIPVAFGGDFGPDLAAVSRATGRSEDEIIETLCSLKLRVFLIGFLPGFPYLGELPSWLRLPRHASPRTAVPAGSMAIAGAQAAVYPWQSPGGWHLLGRTPLQLFDARCPERPALLTPGDTVRFVAIARDAFDSAICSTP
jgi:inhibitor of KinA